MFPAQKQEINIPEDAQTPEYIVYEDVTPKTQIHEADFRHPKPLVGYSSKDDSTSTWLEESSDTQEYEYVGHIKTWLSKCEKHPNCNRRLEAVDAPDFRLPKRLIDLSYHRENSSVKLISGDEIDPAADCRYVALSHCWGDLRKVPKTVADNLSGHQQHLRVETLSKTFQDAITVVRRVGLRYLWIDSLCIVQDLAQELEEQCSQMHLVYGHAYWTLSAQDSADGSGGLFLARDKHSEPEGAWDDAPSGPLSTRGWAYQEHQLSPRVIHFMRSRIVWECRACVAAEDSSTLLYRAFGKMSHKSLSNWRMFDGRRENWLQQPNIDAGRYDYKDDIYIRWLEAVEVFSSRGLSFEQDKLPAMSGLASVVAGFIKDEYLAGHWKKDLQRSLCWMPAWAHGEHYTFAEVQPEACPSWSWASHRGPVQYRFVEKIRCHLSSCFERDVSFDLLSAEIDGTAYNRYGRVFSGSLRVRGYVAHVRILTGDHSLVVTTRPVDLYDNFVDRFGCLMTGLELSGPCVALLDEGTRRPGLESRPIDAVCLQLSTKIWPITGLGLFQPLGLLLSHQVDGTFRRIGVYGLGNDNHRLELSDWHIDTLTIV